MGIACIQIRNIMAVSKNLRNNWPRRFHEKIKVSNKIYGTKDRRLNKVKLNFKQENRYEDE